MSSRLKRLNNNPYAQISSTLFYCMCRANLFDATLVAAVDIKIIFNRNDEKIYLGTRKDITRVHLSDLHSDMSLEKACGK